MPASCPRAQSLEEGWAPRSPSGSGRLRNECGMSLDALRPLYDCHSGLYQHLFVGDLSPISSLHPLLGRGVVVT